jgi:hypothetical protein
MTNERPDLLQLLVAEQVILAVIGKDEVTRDIPHYADLDPEWDAFRGISRHGVTTNHLVCRREFAVSDKGCVPG